GIRALLHVTNDLCFIRARDLQLDDWITAEDAGAIDEEAVTMALRSLETQKVSRFLKEIANELVSYDWRTSTAPSLTEDQRREKLVFRGSGGYKELRSQTLRHLVELRQASSGLAADLLGILGYKK